MYRDLTVAREIFRMREVFKPEHINLFKRKRNLWPLSNLTRFVWVIVTDAAATTTDHEFEFRPSRHASPAKRRRPSATQCSVRVGRAFAPNGVCHTW